MSRNIPTDLLRSFVTVVDLGGFTRAAEALGRTQPAISLQIRRLEDLLQTKLILTAGRQFALTDSGVALGPYARQFLRLNDDIVAHFSETTLTGWIRVGIPTDFAQSYLLEAITGFVAAHPEVKVEIESLLSNDLRSALAKGSLDMVLALLSGDNVPYLVDSALVEPFWAVRENFRPDRNSPLPILRHPDPCEYALRMRNALRRAGRSWKTVLVSRDVAGLQTAVRAGLGAPALTPATLQPGMRIGRLDEGFPPLEPMRIGLFYKHASLQEPGQRLAQHLLEHINSDKKTVLA